jgi:hypothetical protein
MAEPQRKKSPRDLTLAPTNFTTRLVDYGRNRLHAVDTENVDAQDKNPTAPAVVESNLAQLAEGLMQKYHTPLYVIVDEQYQAIYASARTGRFLEWPPGEPQVNLLNVAHPDLRLALQATISQALGQRQVMAHDNITMHLDGQAQRAHPISSSCSLKTWSL